MKFVVIITSIWFLCDNGEWLSNTPSWDKMKEPAHQARVFPCACLPAEVAEDGISNLSGNPKVLRDASASRVENGNKTPQYSHKLHVSPTISSPATSTSRPLYFFELLTLASYRLRDTPPTRAASTPSTQPQPPAQQRTTPGSPTWSA